MDDATKMLEAIASLIGAVAWPLMVLVLVLLLAKIRMDDERGGSVLQRILSRFATAEKLSVKAPGFEVTSEHLRDIAEYAVHSTAAEMKKGDGSAAAGQASVELMANQVASIAERSVTRPLSGTRVLWVDPRPDGNVHERRALEALGISFALARTTDDAIEKLEDDGFRLVISNWTRAGEEAAALTLLNRIKDIDDVPVVIYAGKVDPVRSEAATASGAYGYTTVPRELFDLVTSALQQSWAKARG